MNCTVTRDDESDRRTYGQWTDDLGYVCETLELPWVNNVPNVSSIPLGRYPMTWEQSLRHNEMRWHVNDVPGRGGVEIDHANFVTQIRGCLAVGTTRGQLDGVDAILASATAYNALLRRYEPYQVTGMVLTVVRSVA